MVTICRLIAYLSIHIHAFWIDKLYDSDNVFMFVMYEIMSLVTVAKRVSNIYLVSHFFIS